MFPKNLKNLVNKVDFYYDVTTISSWIMFERFNVTRKRLHSIEYNFRPVHYSSFLTTTGSLVPFTTPTLRKNFYEQQRELARFHGITIGTKHGIIDNLLTELSNTLMPQCFMNLVATQLGYDKLVDFSRILWRKLWIENTPLDQQEMLEIFGNINVPIPSDELVFDIKWGKMVEEWHDELLNKQKGFDLPWTVLHFDNGMTRSFNNLDKWPIIASTLNIEQNQFGFKLPFK